MLKRRARSIISVPNIQIMIMGGRKFPHWMLRLATVSPAKNKRTEMPKLEGFQMWWSFQRRIYFEVIDIRLQSANGQKAGDRNRMPTLIPVMYALAG